MSKDKQVFFALGNQDGKFDQHMDNQQLVKELKMLGTLIATDRNDGIDWQSTAKIVLLAANRLHKLTTHGVV